MSKTQFLRHRVLRRAAPFVGAAAVIVGFAAPAYASGSLHGPSGGTGGSGNYTVVQAGSNTTYLMMQALSDLFNQAPGCNLAAKSGTTQPLDEGCPGLTSYNGLEAGSQPTPQVGENGFAPNWGNENPFNDVLVEEPATGSSNGIAQLEAQGGGSVPNTSPIDAARSSRAPNNASGKDRSGLNFVAYAMDGVSWFHWTEAGGSTTPSASISTLTVTQLISLFEDTNPATCSGATFTPDWACYGSATHAQVNVFWAQSGSGTEGTWAAMLGLSAIPAAISANQIVFENETEQLVNQNSTLPIADDVFFFSYGKYTKVCHPTSGYCGTNNLAANGVSGASTIALGQIAGIPASQASIAAQLPATNISAFNTGCTTTLNKTTIKVSGANVGQILPGDKVHDATAKNAIPASLGDTVTAVSGTTVTLAKAAKKTETSGDTCTFQNPGAFAGDRLLYNVYSDGSNTGDSSHAAIPASSPAALNIISEDGFLCKPATATDIDPNTGSNYHSEISNTILSQGFFTLPLQSDEDATGPGLSNTATGIPHPAWGDGLSASGYNPATTTGSPNQVGYPAGNQDTDGTAVASPATAAKPAGYCLVLTTDGNGNA